MRCALALLLPSLLVLGCNPERRVAHDHLEREGLENIEMVEQETRGAFRYTATLGGDRCVGAIHVQRERGNTRINDQIVCRPLASQCTEKTAATCFRLGRIHAAGDDGGLAPTPPNPQMAAQFFRAACDYGHGRACNEIGVRYAQGDGVARDQAAALAMFTRACDGDAGRGCLNLGISYHHGNGVPVDLKRAARLYQKGCSLGSTSACHNRGVCLRDGVGVERDRSAAMASFTAACGQRHYEACVNLGLLHLDGARGRDEGQARLAFARACQGGLADACRALRELDAR